MADHQLSHVYVRDPARIPEVQGAARGRAGRRRGARRGRQARVRPRPRPLRRARADRRARRVVHVLLLAGRRARRRTSRARSTSTASPATTRSSCSSTRRSACRRWRSARALVRKKLGFRTLMDVIPLDASLVKGSHGRIPDDPSKGPLLMTRQAGPARRRRARGDRRARPDPAAPRRPGPRGGGAMTTVGRKADHLRIAAGSGRGPRRRHRLRAHPAAPPRAARARPRRRSRSRPSCSARGSARR